MNPVDETTGKAHLTIEVYDLTPHVSRQGEISDEVAERARALGPVKYLAVIAAVISGRLV